MDGKTESFSGKTSGTWTCRQLCTKLSYWENLLLFWVMLNKASAHLFILGNNIYTRKNSPTNIYLLKLNNINTRNTCEICSKLTIKTSQRRSNNVFIVNYEHISNLFLVFPTVDFKQVNVCRVSLYQLKNFEITHCSNY